MATTRAELRASLQRKTDSRLTSSSDQDLYLELGDLYVMRRWMTFDPGRYRDARSTASTDSNGILLVDTDTTRIERLEDANKSKYPLISIDERWDRTGYYIAGYDTSNKKAQLQIMKNGAVLDTTAMYWYDLGLVQGLLATGASATDQPAIPEEFRDTIASAAAYLYFRDQGPPFAETSRFWKSELLDDLAEAKLFYKNYSKDPQYVPSDDPDAAGARFIYHTQS